MIFAICKTLNAGYECEIEEMKDAGIKLGDKFELVWAEVGGYSTRVYLKGYDGYFNSVFFNFMDENGNEYDIYSDPEFQYCFYL